MSDHNKNDLLKRAKTLQEKTKNAHSSSGTKNENWWTSFKNKNVSKFSTLTTLLSILSKAYSFFEWIAYKHDDGEIVLDEEGSPTFSKKRFSLFIGSILSALIFIHASISAIYYYSTTFSETVYVTGKQEIITGELYQFGGCTSLPCSTSNDNGKFYLIESSFYFPRLFYPEQEVYANIPQQNAACEVIGYGLYFRNFRWLYKSAQLYQHVTDVSCRPYTKDELERAIKQNTILKKI